MVNIILNQYFQCENEEDLKDMIAFLHSNGIKWIDDVELEHHHELYEFMTYAFFLDSKHSDLSDIVGLKIYSNQRGSAMSWREYKRKVCREDVPLIEYLS